MPSLEIKGKKTGIIFGFRGKNQLPLFMIIKEYFDENVYKINRKHCIIE